MGDVVMADKSQALSHCQGQEFCGGLLFQHKLSR
jgi:hypothetical protein